LLGQNTKDAEGFGDGTEAESGWGEGRNERKWGCVRMEKGEQKTKN
jgi:hypothetical protein